MNRIHRTLLLALAAAALPAAAQAQPFRSDVTGPIPTGSGIAGMGYPVVPVRDIEGALFRQVSGRTAFRTRGIADAVLGEAAAAHQEACSGTLQRPRDWADSTAFTAEAQRVVCGLLSRPGLDTDEARRVLAALRACIPGQPEDTAEALVRALAGLAAVEPAFVDGRQRYIAGERWEAAFTAYDRFLDSVPDGMLDPPPAELRVIAAILDRLVDAGLAASDR
ncbi:hypothetical protein [Longimicrobium sp.]|uniref:hypothetical protein n=1 Tax=Longimicrobium sp. TaxID=2029185 RepID=UPI002E36C624|nr:hypothetical protein [Longimicrobium sp.]HEX6039032.1 hypothetical protein [Longimicrobium sp.]